jgi:hypothetical protein
MTSSDDNSVQLIRAKRKTRAILSARFALQRQLDRIDYDLDVIKPTLAEVDEAAANGTIPIITANLSVDE